MHPYESILRAEIIPALGCTEPAAAALATARAAKLLGEAPARVRVLCSRYIAKNAMNVGIPGTDGQIGLPIAVAMGAVRADDRDGLTLLSTLTDAQRAEAGALIDGGRVEIGIAQTAEKVYVEAWVYGQTHAACAVTEGRHTHCSLLMRDGEVLHRDAAPPAESAAEGPPMTIQSIYRYCMETPVESFAFLEEVISVNREMVREGLRGDWGLRVGRGLLDTREDGFPADDMASRAVAWTAAAADARMAGCDRCVMSTAGSGNQGLTASVPVIAVADALSSPREPLLRALALSELITIHTKRYIGRLSALCGCSISAAVGACCGTVHLLGGGLTQVEHGIRTMVADISGMVCDGAKPGCALKIATSVSAAMRAAALAMRGVGAGERDGIVTGDAESTLKNLGQLGEEGMSQANTTILSMLMYKENTR